MVKITVSFNGDNHPVDVEAELGAEMLQLQIFSLTDVPPHEQSLVGLGPTALTDETDLSALNIQDGTWCVLSQKTASVPAAAPTPAAAAAAPGTMPNAFAQSDLQMAQAMQKQMMAEISSTSTSLHLGLYLETGTLNAAPSHFNARQQLTAAPSRNTKRPLLAGYVCE